MQDVLEEVKDVSEKVQDVLEKVEDVSEKVEDVSKKVISNFQVKAFSGNIAHSIWVGKDWSKSHHQFNLTKHFISPSFSSHHPFHLTIRIQEKVSDPTRSGSDPNYFSMLENYFIKLLINFNYLKRSTN